MGHAGRLLVEQLARLGVSCVFQVPGESFLAVLDGFVDHPEIRLVTGRQEGGVTMMAEAWGKLARSPGVAFVTRGPGAANACAGLHVARQDDTPLVLFVGDVPRGVREREAFQEVDWRRSLAGLVKALLVVDDPARLPEAAPRAFHLATAGRRGPVVVVLPEDVLAAEATVPPLEPAPAPVAVPAEEAVAAVAQELARARRPLLLLGGGDWGEAERLAAERLAHRWQLPLATAFRCQDHVDNHHPAYAGFLGIAPPPHLADYVRAVDLLLVVGTRIDEKTAGDYRLVAAPVPRQRLIHVHPDPHELGRVFRPARALVAHPLPFLERLSGFSAPADPPWAEVTRRLHEAYRRWSTPAAEAVAGVDLGLVMAELARRLSPEAIVTNGAGNFSIWGHRYLRFRRAHTQLGPRSGSMGYALPAAIAAKIRHPGREVVALSGDGDIQMTLQEFATAVQEQAAVVVLVADNGQYGTIRMHQERSFPGRPAGSRLCNPDFAALARAMGGVGLGVERTQDFAEAFEQARRAGQPALIHLRVDPALLAPGRRLTAAER